MVLAETNAAATSMIGAVRNLKAHMLVQEFVREASGVDTRCLVIGSESLGMERRAPKGEFRANLHQGGSKDSTDSGRASHGDSGNQSHGLGPGRSDFLRTEEGPKVLEVNSSPGPAWSPAPQWM